MFESVIRSKELHNFIVDSGGRLGCKNGVDAYPDQRGVVYMVT